MAGDRDWFERELRRHLDPYVKLTDSQVVALHTHFELLLRWNSKINLTSIRSAERIVLRHYCESVFFASRIPWALSEASVCDIGSGAGFPGVPLAVVHQHWQVTLVESHQRKSVFLRESTRHLGNVHVAAVRAESLDTTFDGIVSRAVSPDAVINFVPRLASRIGILTALQDFERLKGSSQLTWDEPIRLPWFEQRLCVFALENHA